jgi:hypothetical protein
VQGGHGASIASSERALKTGNAQYCLTVENTELCHLQLKTTTSDDKKSHLRLSFFGFVRAICYVLNEHSIKSWPLNSKWVSALGHSCSSQYKCSVSKASQRTFGLSTGVLFASNDSKTSFELRKKWPFNQQLRWFFDDKYLTSAVTFPTTAVKICLFKRQICR